MKRKRTMKKKKTKRKNLFRGHQTKTQWVLLRRSFRYTYNGNKTHFFWPKIMEEKNVKRKLLNKTPLHVDDDDTMIIVGKKIKNSTCSLVWKYVNEGKCLTVSFCLYIFRYTQKKQQNTKNNNRIIRNSIFLCYNEHEL